MSRRSCVNRKKLCAAVYISKKNLERKLAKNGFDEIGGGHLALYVIFRNTENICMSLRICCLPYNYN